MQNDFVDIVAQTPEDGKLQRHFARSLAAIGYNPDWPCFLMAKARATLPTALVLGSDFHVLRERLKSCNQHVVLCTIKLLTNAWLTDSRLHAGTVSDC